jgi:predicted RNA binding protein YcfA (HicA-like mRNA interferase family)
VIWIPFISAGNALCFMALFCDASKDLPVGFRLGTGWFPTWNRLVSDLEQAGFRQAQGGKGSHRKFRHPSLRGSILLGGAAADDAKYYQEKQIRNAIGKLTK